MLFLVPAHSGNLMVSDSSSTDIREFTKNAGTFVGSFGETSANLADPVWLAFHPTTNTLFVADQGSDDIREFNGTSGAFIGVFGNTGSSNLQNPSAFVFHPTTGNLLVVDTVNQDIREFNGTTGAFIGIFGETTDEVTRPINLAFHPVTGNLFVSDSSNRDIREFNGITGDFIDIFGETADSLNNPQAFIFHPTTNNLFVSDTGNRDVREFNGTTGDLIGSFGQTAANLSSPLGMVFHPDTNNLLVADSSGREIREFNGTTGSFIGVFGQTDDNLLRPESLAFSPNTPFEIFDSAVFNKNKNQRVVSPYWQSDSSVYTFMAVSHPSLTGMNAQIGMSVHAVLNDRSALFGSTEFTLNRGDTRRLFIAGFDNPVINSTTIVNEPLISGPSGAYHGQLVINNKASHPNVETGNDEGYQDIRMMSFWGAIVIQGTNTGFAMEFIGDNQDSRAVNTSNFSGIN